MKFGQDTLPWQPILWRETATSWHASLLLFVLAFHNGWKDRKTYSPTHTTTPDEPFASCNNFVNFSAVHRWDVFSCVYRGRGWVDTHMQNYAHLHCFLHSLWTAVFTKLSASIEQAVGFIITYWNCDGSLKGRWYGNRFVESVGENWHTTSSFCALAFNNG